MRIWVAALCFVLVPCVCGFDFEEDSVFNVSEEDWERYYHPLPVSDAATYYSRCGRYDAARDRRDSKVGRVHLFAEFERIQRETLANISQGLPYQAVVYLCDGPYARCGGLGDRMRGAISAFFLALVTKRAFFIQSPYPVDLNRFVRPLRKEFCSWSLPSNWRAETADRPSLRVKKVSFSTWLERTKEYQEFSNKLKKLPFNKMLADNDVLFIRTNVYFAWHMAVYHKSKRDLALLGHLEQIDHADNIPYCLLNYLFHPSEAVLAEVRATHPFSSIPLIQRNDTYVAVHIRTGARRFGDPSRVPANTLSQFLACARARQEVLKRSYPQLQSIKYFVASDLPELITQAQARLGASSTITLSGEVIHLDASFSQSWGTAAFKGVQQRTAERGMMRIMVEHFLMAGAPELVLSPSGFGYWSYARQHTLALRDRRREWPFDTDPYTGCLAIPATEETL